MKRSEVRYALYRVKAGTASQEQKEIWERLKPEVDDLGLDINDFSEDWDISKEDPYYVVGRKVAQKLKAEREGSLFSSEGTLVDPEPFIPEPTKKSFSFSNLKTTIIKTLEGN